MYGRVGQGALTGVGDNPGEARRREALRRSMVWCFAGESNPVIRCGVSNSGVAHTLAVCLVECSNMARGNGSKPKAEVSVGLPKFVDVPLDAQAREAFLGWKWESEDLVDELQRLCDAGYRVGCAWTASSQSYTVSVTCRDESSVNAGLCMTSFAKRLDRAVALALFKHNVLAEGNWLGVATATADEFG